MVASQQGDFPLGLENVNQWNITLFWFDEFDYRYDTKYDKNMLDLQMKYQIFNRFLYQIEFYS
jgi:hypothetical protein